MPNASVTITATNKVKQGIDPAKKSLLEFQNTVDQIQKKFKKAFSIASIAAVTVKSFQEMTKAAKQCVQEYTEAEKVFKRLDAVWKNVGKTTGKTYDQIMAYADAMEKQTYFTGEAIEESALLLAATESLTEEGFQRALDVSIDLAAALGEDVTSAAQTLSKAIQEPESALSRLKTIGVSFTEDEKEQIKALTDANKTYEAQALILDKIEQKYKGVAKAINDTPAGLLDNIRDTMGDIRENLGGALLNALAPALESIYGWLTKISGWVAEWSAEQNAQSLRDSLIEGFSDIVIKGSIDSLEDYNTFVEGRKAYKEDASEDSAFQEGGKYFEGYKLTLEAANNVMQKLNDRLNSAIYSVADNGQIVSQEIYDALKLVLDLKPDQYSNLIPYLEEWDKVLSPEAQAKNKAQARSDVSSFVEDNASMSISKRIADLDESLTNAWNSYSLATSQGMDTEAGYILEVIDNLNGQKDELIKIRDGVEETNYNFLENLSDAFAGAIENLGFGDDESKAAAGALLGTAIEGMGEAGEAAETLATNMATMGPLLGAIVTALQYVIKGLMEVIGEALGEQIMIVVDSLMEIGRAIGQILLPIIKTLSPVLEALVQPILVFTGALSYAGQALQHWVANLFNNLADWSIGSWHPFGGLRMDDPGSPGKFGAYLANYMNDYNAGTSSADSASTETALSSASYRGATQVTINIYQMSPVVGENGMRQFAQMIREEFDALDYYGVTA